MPEEKISAPAAEEVKVPTLETAKDFAEYEAIRSGKQAVAEPKKPEEKPAEEKQEEVSVAPPEKEEEEAGEEAESAEEAEPSKETQGEEKPKERKKPSRGIERKFAKMTKTIRTLEEENQGLQARIEELERIKPPPEKVEEKRSVQSQNGRPHRPKAPRMIDFANVDEYEKAMAKHEDAMDDYNEKLLEWKMGAAEKARAEEARKEKQSHDQQQAAEKWDQQLAAVSEHYPDFEEVLESSEEEGTKVTPAMFQAMQDSEHGGHIGYHLMKYPEEAERISQLSPYGQVREIGKLEAKIAETLKGEKSPANTKTVTSAPPPGTRLKPTGSARSTDLYDPKLSWKEWEERRAALEKRR